MDIWNVGRVCVCEKVSEWLGWNLDDVISHVNSIMNNPCPSFVHFYLTRDDIYLIFLFCKAL